MAFACLCLGLAHPAFAATQKVTIDNGSVYYIGTACAGGTITVFMTLTNTDVTYASDGRVIGTFEDPVTHPTCGPYAAANEADKWWVIGGSGWPATLGAYTTPTNQWSDLGYYDPGYKTNVSGAAWGTRQVSFAVKIPAAAINGKTYRLTLATKVSSINGGAADADDRTCIDIPLNCAAPAPRCNVTKRVEGTLGNGNIMVYWLDYDFFYTTGISITDLVPACAVVQSAGASAGGSVGVAGQNITWNLANADASSPTPYRQRGTVWVKVLATGCTPGGQICNTANFSTAQCGSQPTNSICQNEGAVNITLSKAQYDTNYSLLANGSTLPTGSLVNYVLAYNLSGDVLKCFDSFNTYAAGAYHPGSLGALGTGGWMAPPGSNAAATWAVTDSTPAGDKFIKFTRGAAGDYESLLYDCPGSKPGGEDTCLSEIVVDVKHSEPTDPNADVAVWLRNDAQNPAMGYALILTGDLNTGVASLGHLVIQRNNGTAGSGCCTWPADSGNEATNPALENVWYTIKAVEITPGHILAKFWERGLPEPAGWMIDWTDTTSTGPVLGPLPGCATVNGSVGDGHTWKPGLGGQNSENHFDNFHVFSVASITGAAVWDTVPNGMDYVSSGPPAPNGNTGALPESGVVRWNFTGNNYGAMAGVLYSGTGSFTWTGVTDCTDGTTAISNTGAIGATGYPTKNSNTTTLNITCGTPTYTMTSTATPTATLTRTPTPTFTATPTVTPSVTPSATRTITATATPSATVTVTPTVTATRTATPSATPSATVTATPTATPSRTATPTATPSNTLGSTPTYTSTLTATATRTSTPTATPSATITFTRTVTPTATPTATKTSTQSPGPSPTDTYTFTATPTATPSATITFTRTVTPTATPTATRTSTQSPGPSPTDTYTYTSTPTATPSSTITFTRTATPTYTPTSTHTPTQSPGPSATDTYTFTPTPSYTPSFTATLTRTPTSTLTNTRTVTPTSTDTPANTATDTPTRTATPTHTPTFTHTPTATPTRTPSNTRTITPSRTPTPSITVTFTITMTPMPMPHQVVLAAYNSAGELVKLIYEGAAQYLPGSLDLSTGIFIGGDGAVSITFPGVLATGTNTLLWDGLNNSAMMVKGGIYTIKAEIIDPFGQITSLVQTVQVIPGAAQQFLRIFNSAGETVREIRLASPVPGANRLDLPTESFTVEQDPATGAVLNPFKIDVLGNSGWTPAAWDGLNDQGLPVASGSYIVQLVSIEGGKGVVVTSRSVVVIKGVEPNGVLDSALLAPNPVPATAKQLLLFYDASKLMGREPRAQVFNLAGELVGAGEDPGHSGRMELCAGQQMSSGIYMVRFEIRKGSALFKARVLKLAIVR